MAVSLKKGEKVDLTKGRNLKNLVVGLGWDVNAYDGPEFDLDASAFLVGKSGKVTCDEDFVFYSNREDPYGAVVHSGDNRTGEGEGDDEVITVALDKIPSKIDRIAFTCTIYDADKRHQNFGMVSNAYIRVVDGDTNEELVRFDLGEDFSVETAIVAAEIYRKDSDWKFNAIGAGWAGGLAALCGNYGIEVA